MINSILYQVQNIKIYMILFLCIATILLLLLYNKIKSFKPNNSSDITLYGLFMNSTNEDILKIIFNVIKYTAIIYCAWAYRNDVMIYLVMIIITTVGYIILQWNFKGAIVEILNTIVITTSLYVIHIFGNYMLEIEANLYMKLIQILISIFITIYAMYFFFKDYDEMMKYHILKSGGKKNEERNHR